MKIIKIKQGLNIFYFCNGKPHQKNDKPAAIYYNSRKEYYTHGLLHRENGPAIEYANGGKLWYKNGKLHREDGPAVEWSNGDKFWYINGLRHREDGPAIELSDGEKHWFKNNQLHREDGPAVEYANGYKEYWLYDVKLSKENYDFIIQNKEKAKINIVILTNDKLSCSNCNTTNEYAEPNQPNGTYICYNCRG